MTAYSSALRCMGVACNVTLSLRCAACGEGDCVHQEFDATRRDGMRAAKAQGWRYDRAGRWRCPDCVAAGREIPVPDFFQNWP